MRYGDIAAIIKLGLHLETLFRQQTSQQKLVFPAKLTRSLGGRGKLSVSALDGEELENGAGDHLLEAEN